MRPSRLKRFAIWWKNSSVLFRTALITLITLVFLAVQLSFQDSETNLLIFFLLNINVIVLCGLGFVIGRNIVKLVFDRKHNILGSKLRMKLVLAFGGLVLLSTVVLFVFAGGLLSGALENWFSVQVEEAVDGALNIAKHHYTFLRQETSRLAADLSRNIERNNPKDLEEYIENRRKASDIYAVRVVKDNFEFLVDSHNVASEIELFSEPPLDKKAVKRAIDSGAATVSFDEHEASQYIRSYSQLRYNGERYCLMVSIRVAAELTNALQIVNDSYKSYGQLKIHRGPLKTGYLTVLTLITAVILFSAIWFAFYLARQLTDPIKELAESMKQVSRGRYEAMPEPTGDDEIAFLIRSFNTMLVDMQSSRRDAERRRLFIETILSRLIVGVIAINKDNEITVANVSAERLLGLSNATDGLQGKNVFEIVPDAIRESLHYLLQQMEGELFQSEVEVEIAGEKKRIVCTSGGLLDSHGYRIGTVFLFDDITEIAKAQQVAVWREVARRIAHEIKNPLTPIQLSAQRLQKLVADDKAVPVIESVSSIVENVDLIKRLANEFSEFARMPTIDPVPNNINTIIQEVIEMYASGRNDVVLQAITDHHIPDFALDREQIKRLLINLVDNALAAVIDGSEMGKILITSKLQSRTVIIEVSDNGPGIDQKDKVRIFEPYYTTKKAGTGLGLAIALSVVSDHQGTIRVVDNIPHGAKFVIELPLDPRGGTQRRLV